MAIGGGRSDWFLLNGTRNANETWELLKFIESPEQDKFQAVGGFAPPARRSVAADPELLVPKGDPELEELAPDALALPAGRVPGHDGDQFAHVRAQPRPPEPRAGLLVPDEPPPSPVPAEHRLRPHEDQVPLPVAPATAGHY